MGLITDRNPPSSVVDRHGLERVRMVNVYGLEDLLSIAEEYEGAAADVCLQVKRR